MESIWSASAITPKFPGLKEDIKTDVLIIGGGICGILCAYMLKQAGVDCVLVEANEICSGITKNTTAKITVQHGLIYDKIIKKYGEDAARAYFEVQNAALQEYRKLSEHIDCDFTQQSSFVYSLKDRDKIEKEAAALQKIGANAVFTEKTELPFSVVGAVGLKNQAQFHPLKFAFSLAKGLKIYTNTKVLDLKPDCAVTQHGKINAEKIIVATHFPFINKHGSYFLKMYQHRSYVLALKGAPVINNMYVDENEKGMSFRSYNEFLLLGGGGHRTGKSGGAWQELSSFAQANYGGAQEVHRFATQDCMTLDGIAYIGKYSANTPNFYVATGFNKWGMTSSMVSAMLLKDMICGKESKYAKLFSPSRSIFHPQLAINAIEAACGMLRPGAPRCPHLGCALKYNKHEHSWDCSCHGSRFTKDGQLIDNPASDDLSK